MIRTFPVLVFTWLLAGVGAVAGSMVGNAFGQTGLFAGAIGGGLITTVIAVLLSVKLQWLPRPSRTGAVVGAIVGFGMAAPIAASNLHTPIIPIVVTSLAGIGALIGAGFTTGRR